MGTRRTVCTAGLIAVGLGVSAQALAQLTDAEMQALEGKLPQPSSAPVDFDQHIRPIFETSCLSCHGPERPKSGFRLDTREAALKGGDAGAAIVPGQSSRSPLIHYVARLVEDMEMPPDGKGDPLTAEHVATLRAWIDQGAPWSTSQTNQNRIEFSVVPSVQWFSVKGDERKFREHTGIKEGWNGGLQSLLVQQQLGPDRRLTLEARAFPNPEEYKFRLQVEQRDLGFARFGFEQYREYYDDTGGFYPLLTPPAFTLGRDLHLDIGRAYADFGLTLPNLPKMVFGYEFQYRDGTKSILQWGDVGTIEPNFDPATDAKKIYPATKQIDEQVHVFKFDLTHDIAGVSLENNFRAELYDNDTVRQTTGFNDLSDAGMNRTFTIKEGHDHFQAADSFRLEKQVLDWLFLSGGYRYAHLDGEYGLRVQPNFPTGEFLSFDRYYFTDAIILEQDTHTVNANVQLGPWSGLTIYGGAQTEWMSQHGFGDVRLDEGLPPSLGGITPLPVFLDSDLDRAAIEEHAGARFTGLPFTVLFVEGRAMQESIGQTESRTGTPAEFLRDTDTTGELYEGRVGFTISPWTPVSLTAHYKKRQRGWDHDHDIDFDEFRGPNGYSAFITSRDVDLDEVSTKLSIRPANWIKIGLTYQLIATDSDHETTSIPVGEFGETPGGAIIAYNSDAHVYSANVAFNPWRRLYLNNTFSYRQSRSWTGHDYSPVVADYEGDLYSTITSATYILNEKTDLTATYSYSWADYDQNNLAAGLPLGIVYDWHILTAGITRRFKKNISTNLQYRFYQYDEESSGGKNNYTAHGVIASLAMTFN